MIFFFFFFNLQLEKGPPSTVNMTAQFRAPLGFSKFMLNVTSEAALGLGRNNYFCLPLLYFLYRGS